MKKQPNGFFTLMAATFIFVIILSPLMNTVAAQTRPSNLTRGSSLTPTGNSSWLSRSGLYAFGFYPQGGGYAVGIILAGIPEKTVVWTANRDDPPVASNVTMQLTSDGRLILQPAQGQGKSVVNAAQLISYASMLDSGNFVLYDSDQDVIWESFDYPTDTILPGQHLSPGKELVSSASETDHSAGIFRLKMQNDGNLVQYPVETPDTAPFSYYSSGTDGDGNNITLNLDGSGYLYLLNSSINVLKNLTQRGSPVENTIFLMRIDADGIFRVYSHSLDPTGNWSTVWESNGDGCVAKGLCGLNGFCVSIDDKVDCRCLPGFDWVLPGKWSSGCERNFTAESCKNDGGGPQDTMIRVDNTVWEDDSYQELSSTTREGCETACLEDCNCEAAAFKDGNCRKQRLPLRYGRRLTSDSNIALVKVGSSGAISPGFPAGPRPTENPKDQNPKFVIISAAFAAFAFVVLAISGVLLYKNQVWAYRKISEKGGIELGEDVSPRAFTFSELEQITNGFKEELGKGAFGTVYKGIIQYNQKVVAVKRLEKVLAEGEREFQTEIRVIGRTHHRNLVRLIGFCLDGPNRLLVYEYMSNGSLSDFLFAPEKRPSWEDRIEIALNIARGILYLHEECETQIIHCDIKPQNILMDQQWCAKISDFGLAKLLKPDQTKTYTGIRGTRGYVAPEWHRKLPVTVKADVYSFGVVLLEIVCCRRSLDWSLGEEMAVLEEWVYDCFEAGELGRVVGEEVVDRRKLERMVKVGLWCIQDEPSLRPSMKKVLLMLEGTVEIPAPPSPASFLSAI